MTNNDSNDPSTGGRKREGEEWFNCREPLLFPLSRWNTTFWPERSPVKEEKRRSARCTIHTTVSFSSFYQVWSLGQKLLLSRPPHRPPPSPSQWRTKGTAAPLPFFANSNQSLSTSHYVSNMPPPTCCSSQVLHLHFYEKTLS